MERDKAPKILLFGNAVMIVAAGCGVVIPGFRKFAGDEASSAQSTETAVASPEIAVTSRPTRTPAPKPTPSPTIIDPYRSLRENPSQQSDVWPTGGPTGQARLATLTPIVYPTQPPLRDGSPSQADNVVGGEQPSPDEIPPSSIPTSRTNTRQSSTPPQSFSNVPVAIPGCPSVEALVTQDKVLAAYLRSLGCQVVDVIPQLPSTSDPPSSAAIAEPAARVPEAASTEKNQDQPEEMVQVYEGSISYNLLIDRLQKLGVKEAFEPDTDLDTLIDLYNNIYPISIIPTPGPAISTSVPLPPPLPTATSTPEPEPNIRTRQAQKKGGQFVSDSSDWAVECNNRLVNLIDVYNWDKWVDKNKNALNLHDFGPNDLTRLQFLKKGYGQLLDDEMQDILAEAMKYNRQERQALCVNPLTEK